MFGVPHSQDLADYYEHDCDVGGDGDLLVGAEHDDIDGDDGQLRQDSFYKLLQLYYGRNDHFLLSTSFPFNRTFSLHHRGRRFVLVLVLVVDWIDLGLPHDHFALIYIFLLEVDLKLVLPLVCFLYDFDHFNHQHHDYDEADQDLGGHGVGVESAAELIAVVLDEGLGGGQEWCGCIVHFE